MWTRRDALRASLAAGTTLALGGASGCGDDGSLLTLAVFEPTDDAALVSVSGLPGDTVTLTVATALEEPVASRSFVLDARGLARVELRALSSATAYRLQTTGSMGAAPWHGFSTLPAPTARTPFRLLFSADIDPDPQFASPICETMAAMGADAFLCLGDWPYADNPPGAITLDEYHARHRQAREFVAMGSVLRTMPIFAIYDDHEVRNNWDRATYTRETDRHLAAMAAWDEWFPLWLPPSGEIRYRKIALGALADLFILDTRRHRDANADPDGPGKTMLGAAQKSWLFAELSASTAPFKLIVTSVPLDHGMPEDHWAAFATERAELLAFLRDGPISGVLFLTADQHWFAAHEHPYGIREFQVGPISRGLPVLPVAGPGVLATASAYNFGCIDLVDGEAGDPGDPVGPRLVFTAHDADGLELYSESFSPIDLTPV